MGTKRDKTEKSTPYGYRNVEGSHAIDPHEAPVRQLIYREFLLHRRVKTVARRLNEMGLRTRSGSLWSDSTIARILADPIAAGVSQPADDRLITEPIITKSIWENCQNILKDRHSGVQPAKRPTHLFAGLTLCTCGAKMTVPSRAAKYVCQGCKIKIPTEDLEHIFGEQLRSLTVDSDTIKQGGDDAEQRIEEQETLLNTLQSEQRKLKLEMDALVLLHRRGQLPTLSFGKRYRPLEERSQAIANHIPAIQGEVDAYMLRHSKPPSVVPRANFNLRDVWLKMEFEEKRSIVEVLVSRVTIGRDSVDFDLTDITQVLENATHWQRGCSEMQPNALTVVEPNKLAQSKAKLAADTTETQDSRIRANSRVDAEKNLPANNQLEIERTDDGIVIIRRRAVGALVTLKGVQARLFLSIASCTPRDVRFVDVLKQWMHEEGRARISIEYLAKIARTIRHALGPELCGFWSNSGSRAAWTPPNSPK